MSNICEIKVPDVGNVHDIDVVEVSIQAGDVIVLDQTIATLETDKASMDLPATATGTVQQVHIKVGDKVNEGTLIATVLVDDVTAVPATPVLKQLLLQKLNPLKRCLLPLRQLKSTCQLLNQ